MGRMVGLNMEELFRSPRQGWNVYRSAVLEASHRTVSIGGYALTINISLLRSED